MITCKFNGKEFTAKIPADKFRIGMVDCAKNGYINSYCNAGYFGVYHEEKKKHAFTLPDGHLMADYQVLSPWVLHYAYERGKFKNNKWVFNGSTWGYLNDHKGKAISTLMLIDDEFKIDAVKTLDAKCKYAISGTPIIINNNACTMKDVKAQGYSASPLYNTYHIFACLKDDDPTNVYIIGMKTNTKNMVSSGEAYKKLKEYSNVIKLDGGGSYYCKFGSKAVSTGGARRINTIIDLGGFV